MSQPTRSPAASDEPPSGRGGEDGGTEQYTDKAYLLTTREPETTETTFTFLGWIKLTVKSMTRVGSDNNGADAFMKVGLTTGGVSVVPMAAGAMLGASPDLSLLSGTGLGGVALLLYFVFLGRRRKARSPKEPRGSTS